MNWAMLRRRVCCLVFGAVVGAFAVGPSPSPLAAQDQLDRPVSIDNPYRQNYDGRNPEAIRLPESFLGWMIRASGIFGFLILLTAFVMVSIIMLIALQLRRDNYLPAAFIEDFEQQLLAKDYQGAYEAAKGNDSFIGHVLAAGMGRLSRGYEEAVQQMQQVGEDETMTMEHKIGYLSLIGTIAPMLGLLGTVQGMVLSFQVISRMSSVPKPADLADGIAMSLFTTLEGMVVAIPAIVFYSLYKNRLSRFVMECGFVAENLMKNFHGMKPATVISRQGGGTPASVASAPHME